MQMMTRKTIGTVALVALALAAAGCESNPGRQKSTRALGTLKDTRAELVTARAEIERTLGDLGKIEARPANLTPAFKSYQSNVEAVSRRYTTIQSRVQDMRLRSQEYSDSWAAKTQQFSEPEVRGLAEARNERVSAQYAKADASAQAVRDAYGPFLTRARDAETFLSYDLTYGGVQSAGPLFETVRSSGAELLQKIDVMITDLDATAARLSPTTRTTPMP